MNYHKEIAQERLKLKRLLRVQKYFLMYGLPTGIVTILYFIYKLITL